jgi:hypothetical protein
MTPKKDIVREPTHKTPCGLLIPKMGAGLTKRENAFIYWYSERKADSFLNAGRAAIRAGYKSGTAVIQGCQLKQKPHIAKILNDVIPYVKAQLDGIVYRIAFLCADRMFWTITDFFRDCKRTVKDRWGEREINSFEVIPLDEIPERKRMCIDQVTIKTIAGKDEVWYKLADRNKAHELFMKCYKMIIPNDDNEDRAYKEMAEILRGDNPTLPQKTTKAWTQITDNASKHPLSQSAIEKPLKNP